MVSGRNNPRNPVIKMKRNSIIASYAAGVPALALLALLALPSCHKDEAEEKIPMSTTPITITTPLLDWETKGIDPLQDANLKNFGVSAIFNYDEDGDNQWYLKEQAIVKQDGDTPWTINPKAYWPLLGDLCFFFHAPSNINYPEIKFIETTTGFPKVEYAPTTDVTRQIDFCVGVPDMHFTRLDNPIPVQFVHTLTQVTFEANYTGIVPAGYFVLIDSVKVKNVIGTNTVTYRADDPYFEWESDSGHTADSAYVLQRTKNHIRQDSLRRSTGLSPDTYYPLINSAGRLYLLPQTLGPNASLEVSYGFYYNYGASPTAIALFTKVLPLPEGQIWPAGKTVNYRLCLDVGISSPLRLESSITDWVSSGNTHTPYEFE